MGLFLSFVSCSIDLIISVFVPVPCCFDDCSFVVPGEVKEPDFPAPFFFLKIALALWGLLCLHTNLKIFCSSSMKNSIGIWIGIVLNL